MNMKSCVHFNYGYYGPKKGCMIGKTCKCESYMSRAMAVKMKINHNLIVKKKDVPLGVSKGVMGSSKRRHLLIEKVDKVKLLYCTAGTEVRLINSCPRGCHDRC